MVYGVIPFDEMGLPLPALGWWFPELSALFLVGRCRHRPHRPHERGGAGGDLSWPAARTFWAWRFIIGISRGITVLMNDGAITDTVLHWGEEALCRRRGRSASRCWCSLLYLPLTILIPSSSGLATLSIPIVAPLGKFAGRGRRPGGDGVPVRLRPGEHHHPHGGGGDGRPGPGPCALRPLGQVCVEADTLCFLLLALAFLVAGVLLG